MSEKVKVLIVDDEYQFCKSLSSYMEKTGFEVKFTTNGEEGLDLIEKFQPDAMTLDMRMPGMNGYEVLEKAKWKNNDMKIVVITAIDVPNMEEMLEHSGAHATFTKPIDLEALVEKIKELTAG